ncbi:hypothetical protein F7725_003914 [Dissostichus mawsoni]|uniref:Uncharacterized protein n=1 Tax=Dissostichus mawsoni TaxID=36200 RepID=A0A7J5YBI9_DISMA|nr:hypothetical protein F7725_003914 [Dissostichus mawsoni]
MELQGRTLHSRVSLISLHLALSLVTRDETPIPQLREHWDQEGYSFQKDAVCSAHIVAIVALQSLVMVAGSSSLLAVLVQLRGADLTAAASVRHGGDARGQEGGPAHTHTSGQPADT